MKKMNKWVFYGYVIVGVCLIGVSIFFISGSLHKSKQMEVDEEVAQLNSVYDEVTKNNPIFYHKYCDKKIEGYDLNLAAGLVYGLNEEDISKEARLQFISQFFIKEEDFTNSMYGAINMYYLADVFGTYDYFHSARNFYDTYLGDTNYKFLPDISEFLIKDSTLDLTGYYGMKELSLDNSMNCYSYASGSSYASFVNFATNAIINNSDRPFYSGVIVYMCHQYGLLVVNEKVGYDLWEEYVKDGPFFSAEKETFVKYISKQ